MDINHGPFDQVSSAALDDGIDGKSLCLGTPAAVLALEVADRAATTQDGLRMARLVGLCDAFVDEGPNRGVASEILVDELLGAGGAHASRSGQPDGSLPVDETEVHRLAP